MKAREAFEQILNRKDTMSLKTKMILLVTAEIVLSLLFALGTTALVSEIAAVDSGIVLFIEILLLGLIIGAFVTAFLSKLFFVPVKKLREAITKVADGDFSVQLDVKNYSKEIQEIYSGFNLMVQELQSTEILQTDFVSNVSHEFKTPINAIEGYSTLLQDYDNLNDDQKEYVEKIIFNTKRLSTLVGNILLLSKIENLDIRSSQSTFRIDEQIRQVIVMLEPAWAEKDIQFDVELDSINYTGSENLLHHVWSNIIGNAIKFSPQEGTVKISLYSVGNRIIFAVEDHGPGISEEAKKHLFDKFYQADTSHKEEGNGLGLALVKRILMIEGGLISAENTEDGGCVFTVTLFNK